MSAGWFKNEKVSPCGIKSENMLSSIGVNATEMRVAIIVTKNVSLRNWKTNCLFVLPMVLRMPISLARFVACAVVRFIKLIQPSKRRNDAMASNPYKVDLFATRSPMPG